MDSSSSSSSSTNKGGGENRERRNHHWFSFSFHHRKTTQKASSTKAQQQKAPGISTNAFLAGYTAGITGTLVGHPLDSLKVWVQTGQGLSSGKGSNGGGTSLTPTGVLRSLRQSYSGVWGPLLTVGLIQSINFTAYDSMRRFWYNNFDNPEGNADPHAYLTQDSFTSVAVSGIAAGAVVSAVTQPVYAVKTIQQTQHIKFSEGIRHWLRRPLVGYGTHLFVETGNRSIYFVTYEALKRKYTNERGETLLVTRMTSAAVSGIACWLFIYPTDVLRSRLYAAAANNQHYGATQMMRHMYKEGGLRSFFQGFSVTMFRAGPVAAVILPVYDIVLGGLNAVW